MAFGHRKRRSRLLPRGMGQVAWMRHKPLYPIIHTLSGMRCQSTSVATFKQQSRFGFDKRWLGLDHCFSPPICRRACLCLPLFAVVPTAYSAISSDGTNRSVVGTQGKRHGHGLSTILRRCQGQFVCVRAAGRLPGNRARQETCSTATDMAPRNNFLTVPLLPGRRIVSTQYRKEYLGAIMDKSLPAISGQPPPGRVTDTVFAVTSCNKSSSGSRRPANDQHDINREIYCPEVDYCLGHEGIKPNRAHEALPGMAEQYRRVSRQGKGGNSHAPQTPL